MLTPPSNSAFSVATAGLILLGLLITPSSGADSDDLNIRDDTGTRLQLGYGFDNRFSQQTRDEAIDRLQKLRDQDTPIKLKDFIGRDIRTIRVTSYAKSSNGSHQGFGDVKSRVRNALNSQVLHGRNSSYHPTLTPPDTSLSADITAWIVLHNGQTCRLEIGPPHGNFFFQDAHGTSWWHKDVLLAQYLAVKRLWKKTTGNDEPEYEPITRNDLKSYIATWKGKGQTGGFELRLNEDGTWKSHFEQTGIARLNKDGTRTPVGQTGRTGYWYLYHGVFLLRDTKLGMDPRPNLGPLLLLNNKQFRILLLKEAPSGFVSLQKASDKK